MKKNYQRTLRPRGRRAARGVTVAMAELAGDVQEGLLVMAVGTGLQAMAARMNADVEGVWIEGRHDANRDAVRHGSGDGSDALGGKRP